MCLLAIHFRSLAGAPLLVAANREEFYARNSRPPHLQGRRPEVLCGVDAVAGGTWLGLNELGLIVGVTNRSDHPPPPEPRSRGLLAGDLLGCNSAEEAAAKARDELASGRYAGANYLLADSRHAYVLSWNGGLRTESLAPGLHVLTNADLDDPRDSRQALARRLLNSRPLSSIDEFLVDAAQTCSVLGPMDETIVLRGVDRGTVSSTLIAVADRRTESRYLFANGAPDRTPYDDLTPLLAALFGGE